MYATANLHDKYLRDAVSTAGPIDLIIMLYDGCIKNLRLAALYQDEKRIEDRTRALGKAEDIIDELMRCLDLSIPLSHDLMALYEFMMEQMFQANMTQDMTILDPVIEMLNELRDAWKSVKVQTGKLYMQD